MIKIMFAVIAAIVMAVAYVVSAGDKLSEARKRHPVGTAIIWGFGLLSAFLTIIGALDYFIPSQPLALTAPVEMGPAESPVTTNLPPTKTLRTILS